MICASCFQSVPDRKFLDECAPCTGCGGGLLLGGREGCYRLLERLPTHGTLLVYRAERVEDGAAVCIKEARYVGPEALAAEERLRREGRLLRQLTHPALPAFIELFVRERPPAPGSYLVEEWIDGETLAGELEHHRYTLDEVLALLAETAELLAYLHALSPPVVHADVSAAHLMRRRADGRLVLVGFGRAIEDGILPADDEAEPGASNLWLGASPVGGGMRSRRAGTGDVGHRAAGTGATDGRDAVSWALGGPVAPELLAGRAEPASDLYALGVLALHLVLRREPARLVDAYDRLRWRTALLVNGAGALEPLLDWLLEPRPEDRACSARAVSEACRDLQQGGLPRELAVRRRRVRAQLWRRRALRACVMVVALGLSASTGFATSRWVQGARAAAAAVSAPGAGRAVHTRGHGSPVLPSPARLRLPWADPPRLRLIVHAPGGLPDEVHADTEGDSDDPGAEDIARPDADADGDDPAEEPEDHGDQQQDHGDPGEPPDEPHDGCQGGGPGAAPALAGLQLA